LKDEKQNRPVGGEHHLPLEVDVDETWRGRHAGPDFDAAKRDKELREVEEKR
jgi:hypothetical protein